MVYDVTGNGHDAEGGVRLPEAQIRGKSLHTSSLSGHIVGKEERPQQSHQESGGKIHRQIKSR